MGEFDLDPRMLGRNAGWVAYRDGGQLGRPMQMTPSLGCYTTACTLNGSTCEGTCDSTCPCTTQTCDGTTGHPCAC